VPQVAAAIATFFYSAGAAVGLSAGAAATFAVAATNALAYATNAFLLNKAMASISKRGKTGETRGLEASFTDSTADARAIYGEVRVGGVNIIPPVTSGTDGEYQHQVLAIASHEIDSFQAYYFDQDTLPSPAAVSGGSGDGLISTGKYANHAWVRGYRGTMTQNVDFILNAAFPSQWASTARGRGHAYVALTYGWGKGKVYQGIPSATFKVRGAKVYDPRLDSTNGGSGTHRYNDPTTWEYSHGGSILGNNPALCWANFKMAAYGHGVDPATKINWTSVAAAADICDALVANQAGGTSKRYTCNGMLICSPENYLSNEQALVDAMMGHRREVAGKWEIIAGGWTTPDWTISKVDWVTIENIQAVAGPDDGRVNGVHCFYVDPARNWQRVECYPRRNPTYLLDDTSKTAEIEMEQPLCTDESEAQRKAEFLLRASRNGIVIIGLLPPRFQKIRTYDTAALTFEELGWVSKTFRIAAKNDNIDGSIRVTLIEEQDTDWTDLASGDYGAPSTWALPTTNPTRPTVPTTFSIAVNAGTIIANWNDPVVKPIGTEYAIYRGATDSTAVASREEVWRGSALQAVFQSGVNSAYYYWLRSEAGSYVAGGYMPASFGLLATPEGLNGGVPVFRNADFTANSLDTSWDIGSASQVALTPGAGIRGAGVRVNAVASYNNIFTPGLFYLRQLSHVQIDTRTVGFQVEVGYRVNSAWNGGGLHALYGVYGVTDLAGNFADCGGGNVAIGVGEAGIGNYGQSVLKGFIQGSGSLKYPFLRVTGIDATSGQADINHIQGYIR
jgi:hypothetical protein